jgi:hypothetical protein
MVTMASVEGVTKARLGLLRGGGSHWTFEDDYMDTEVGTRGLIRVMDRPGEVTALEFIEPEEFWADPDAVEEYGETLADGVGVTVIVPDDERADAEEMLGEEVGKAVIVLGYSEIGNPPHYQA